MSIAETLAGGAGIVDLWCYFPEGTDDPGLMTPGERNRHDRFHFERDRRMFLATRVLVRTVLSRYAAVPPGDWRFAEGKYGKPHVSAPRVAPYLHFNLANTDGLATCAVSVAHEAVGVDAEWMDRKTGDIELADHYFSREEARALRALPASEQRRRFFAYWTLKESYIKARGMGLALPLEQFSFTLDTDTVRVAFDTRLADDAARWRFALFEAPSRHMIAVGVDTGGAALSVRVAHVVP